MLLTRAPRAPRKRRRDQLAVATGYSNLGTIARFTSHVFNNYGAVLNLGNLGLKKSMNKSEIQRLILIQDHDSQYQDLTKAADRLPWVVLQYPLTIW